MISIEVKDIEKHHELELNIFIDEDGIRLLTENLQSLSNSKDHFHMMTPSWSGNELSEVQFDKGSTLVNHLCVTFIDHS